MLATIAYIVLIVWLVGLIAHVAGGFIHLLLLVGLILLAVHFLSGRRTGANRV